MSPLYASLFVIVCLSACQSLNVVCLSSSCTKNGAFPAGTFGSAESNRATNSSLLNKSPPSPTTSL